MPEPEQLEPTDSDESGEQGDIYFILDDGGAVCRLRDGWERQVWRPSLKEWTEIDADFAVDAREVPEQEALAAMSGGGSQGEFGEFSPQNPGGTSEQTA